MRRPAWLLLFAFFVSLTATPSAPAQARFLGSIIIVSFNFPPKGFALCNGQLLAINQNQALFALLGTTYGGDGITTFALPDLRGRAPIHRGQGPGLQSYAQGQNGGEETVTLDITQIPNHSHVAMASASPANTGSVAGASWGRPRVLLYSASAPSTPMSFAALSPAGGSQPHDNLKPYLVVNYAIALQGIFPSRN
jgi:microcystin-dependent protein